MTVELGECLDLMGRLAPDSVDAIVTDPPYALTANKKGGSGMASVNTASPAGRSLIGTGFMGMGWDGAIPGPETWAAALRVAKPGAHLVAFGGTRTYHRLTCAIEDAGWEIRDCLSWLYGSGFPKSHNLDGDYDGWGTALKPGWEPIVLARKPVVGSVAANMARHGVGALHIDANRIGNGVGDTREGEESAARRYAERGSTDFAPTPGPRGGDARGRWPANVALDDVAAAQLDEQSGELTSGANPTRRGTNKFATTYGDFAGQERCDPARGVDVGGASRFYYCAKASRAEREEGLEAMPLRAFAQSNGGQSAVEDGDEYQAEGAVGLNRIRQVRNHHPTVKPVALMRWLIRLVSPAGGLVLDPFTGSGTTGVAAALEGRAFHGIEREAEYLTIARARIAHATAQPHLWAPA